VLCHVCAPLWNYGSGLAGAHRELFTQGASIRLKAEG
jgi:hypothetical protein